jgi:hypothetical protein
MINLLSNLKIAVPKKVFIKDPGSSDSGKIISKHNIFIIDETGSNAFTFKKLGVKIESNESSIYRYFENSQPLCQFDHVVLGLGEVPTCSCTT